MIKSTVVDEKKRSLERAHLGDLAGINRIDRRRSYFRFFDPKLGKYRQKTVQEITQEAIDFCVAQGIDWKNKIKDPNKLIRDWHIEDGIYD